MFALKGDVPTVPTDLITDEDLINTLNDYVVKNNAIINENLTIKSTLDTALKIESNPDIINPYDFDLVNISRKNIPEGYYIGMAIGAKYGGNAHVHYGYKHYGIGVLGTLDNPEMISFSNYGVNINQLMNINKSTTVNGAITFNNETVFNKCINVTSTNDADSENLIQLLKPNMINFQDVQLLIGKNTEPSGGFVIDYVHPDIAYFRINGATNAFLISSNSMNIFQPVEMKDVRITGSVECQALDDKYIAKNDNAALNGSLTINKNNISTPIINLNTNSNTDNKSGIINIITSGSNTCIYGMSIFAPNLKDDQTLILTIGSHADKQKLAYFGYKSPGTGTLGLYANVHIITYTSTAINLNRNTTVNGNLTVNGTFHATTTNTTITHYCPIEGNINDFKIGVPVFMSGKVYKRSSTSWILSTPTDRTDCISSVQLKGNHKSYVGVCVEIDRLNNSITFASHGDFMFDVEDSSLYEVGDVILYDGRILEDDLTVTSLLLQSVVGKITSIINDHTVAIFKD